MHRVNQTAQHVIGAGSTTDIRTGECEREREGEVLTGCEVIVCVRARVCVLQRPWRSLPNSAPLTTR